MAGGAQAKMSTWFSKPNQSLISKVTKKRVGFNLKIFVFALLKTVHCRAERNPGRIGRLFNCNDRCFFIWREAPKPKCLPWFSKPNQSLISKVTIKRVAFSCLRSLELFWLVCQLPSTLTSDEDSFNSHSLPDMSEFLFLLLRGGGVLIFRVWYKI